MPRLVIGQQRERKANASVIRYLKMLNDKNAKNKGTPFIPPESPYKESPYLERKNQNLLQKGKKGKYEAEYAYLKAELKRLS